MSDSAPHTRWWQLPALALVLVGVEWLVERQSTSAARDAALRAADAAIVAAGVRLDDLGPLEVRRGEWLADGRPIDLSRISGPGGFQVRLSADPSGCPLPSAERIVLVERRTAQGYAWDADRWWVVRCDPVRDRHGQVAGMLTVAAPAEGFAGNAWRVRSALLPALVGLFGVAAAAWLAVRRAHREVWLQQEAIEEQNARTEAASALLRRRAEELESARAQAEGARVEAENANASKSVFLANMSHELRTPLNAIIGYAELLKDEVAPEHRGDVAQVLEAANGLVTTITTILDLTKLEAGSLDLELQRFDVRGLLGDLQVATERLVAAQGNTLKIEVDPQLGDMRADVARVRQILWNLVSNAAKFTESGEIVISAYLVPADRLDGEGDEDRVAFSVVDTGIGMDEDLVARAFDAFVQHDASDTRRHGGTGVGLTLVRALAERMGGTVTARSALGVGSEFTVILPREVRIRAGTLSVPPTS